MKFKITRTSDSRSDKPESIEGGTLVEENFTGIYANGHPYAYTLRYHTIEINTLEELIQLSDTHGELIIKNDLVNDRGPSIEIYDDYRE